jgi:UDP-2-acetamido-3-amino-2,3-dideoxy-glucuronate N-acetyltransferase
MSGKYFVHPSSYIENPVIIGDKTRIMHFCHIMPHAIIGSNCIIGRNVTVEPGVIIGNNVTIEDNVMIKSGTIIEDNVICGPSIVFTLAPVIRPRDIKPKPSKLRPTIIKMGASIGANSTIICGNTLGVYAMIGAGSVITMPVPNYAFVYGNPARAAGWACQCGSVINFKNSRAICKYCKSIYQMLELNEVVKVA